MIMYVSRWLLILGAGALSVGLVSAAQQSGKKLSPQTDEFLSRARYLISKDERKELLALPEDQQADFIERFWERRDPDPSTPTNEFKDEYFRRIRLADGMFTGESQPGWLTDRGRILILYGEPTRRERQPPPPGKKDPCLETWSYDSFPVVFSDKNCTGAFTLATRDLDPIRSRNIAVAARSRSLRETRGLPFDVEVHILKKPIQGDKLEGLVRLDMPYSGIWFGAEDGNFETAFAVEMELTDSQKVVRWTFKNSYPVRLTGAELKEKQKDMFEITVPMTIEGNVAELRAGKCRLSITMENETSKERIRKVAEFSF
jgi:GWxTD domain-containing protein